LSRRVIEHNRARFPKRIQSVNVRELPDDDRPVIQLTYPALEQAAADVARKLSHGRRGGLVCLARTTRLLRMIAAACVPLDVKISAPEAVFDARGARAAVEAYARLFSGLGRASAEDVITVCRHPGRGLPFDAEEQVAAWLRDGRSFTDTLTGLPAPDYARTRLARTGELFDRLARQADNAHRFLRTLRTEGGLDEHFREYEQTFGGAEQVETETLDDLTELAAGKTLAQLAALLAEQTSKLKAIRDDEHGVEITTVHRAKGRQWPTVIVFGCDEEQLPHKRSLEDAAAGLKHALEAERRVAYVAFTRAQQRLVILSTKGGESRFVGEAGFGITPPGPAEIGRITSEDDFHRPWKMPRLAAQKAIRSGAWPPDILGSCRSLTDALHVLAHAVIQYDGADRRHRALGRQPIGELLTAIVGVGPTVSARILGAASIPPAATLSALSDRQSNRLYETLRRVAAEPRARETKPRKQRRRFA
jgi:DNA helicase-2/ATP-dependent DNA helicase PcrA